MHITLLCNTVVLACIPSSILCYTLGAMLVFHSVVNVWTPMLVLLLLTEDVHANKAY